MIAIIDYDAGNIRSVEKALHFLGQQVEITRDASVIASADKVILPGVGAFGSAMERIRSYKLEEVIHTVVDKGTPFLGICLGLQLLFEESEESPGVQGLSLLKGRILKFKDEPDIKIPHMGWNSLDLHNDGQLFKGINEGAYVYFVHSYYLKADDRNVVTASSTYGATEIDASVEKGSIYGCQFHPEKSSGTGIRILRNFLSL